MLREKENQVLSDRARQVSRRSPHRSFIGLSWHNVFISATGHYINATCEYVSDHAYFFVDNRDIAAMGPHLASYGAAFDALYETNHNKFGTENDVDNNGKVVIIFSEELTGGLTRYFSSVDEYPKAAYAASNEGDILYITTNAVYQGDGVNRTLAHEFQHMIYFDQHYNRGVTSTYTWLNEALSQAAEYYTGYTGSHLDWIAYFLIIIGWGSR
ncbi:MAG: hypothetical protein ACM3ZC_01850 [Bacteroidota bacterium]